MKKLKLRVESLTVESFRTAPEAGRQGTVNGHADDCTWFASCLCKTAYYHCGTGPATIHSCTYTNDLRCEDTNYDACTGTEWEVCGTGTPPVFTPACQEGG